MRDTAIMGLLGLATGLATALINPFTGQANALVEQLSAGSEWGRSAWRLVATLGPGCVTAIAPDGSVRAVLPVPIDDPMVTNVCFGGPDLRTAYVTSSGLGRLYAVDWHCAGHPLAYPPSDTGD